MHALVFFSSSFSSSFFFFFLLLSSSLVLSESPTLQQFPIPTDRKPLSFLSKRDCAAFHTKEACENVQNLLSLPKPPSPTCGWDDGWFTGKFYSIVALYPGHCINIDGDCCQST